MDGHLPLLLLLLLLLFDWEKRKSAERNTLKNVLVKVRSRKILIISGIGQKDDLEEYYI